jgi:lipopolysaccharide/colanic/teichoic acid biosynthesis glycosyltransferase
MLAQTVSSAVRKLVKWFRPATQDVVVLQNAYPPPQTLKALARERARADRSGSRLSVLTFVPREDDDNPMIWATLGKILEERLRATDEVGWMEDGQLWVLLPATETAGAWKVADDIILQFPNDQTPPTIQIYAYPSERSESGGTSGESPRNRVLPLEPIFHRDMPLWKRTVDVLGAGCGLVLLAPLFAVVALAIKWTSPGPVFFKQKRSGRGGRPFFMWKFRSMVEDAEAKKKDLMALNEQDGPAFKIRSDPRITPLGRFLRETSIDELPQLFNVLTGDMSLVGPRPLPCHETEGCAGWQRQRLEVTPGLTCIWQIKGRSRVSFADWVRMDIQYIRKSSVWQDLKLLLMTVPVLFHRKGAC